MVKTVFHADVLDQKRFYNNNIFHNRVYSDALRGDDATSEETLLTSLKKFADDINMKKYNLVYLFECFRCNESQRVATNMIESGVITAPHRHNFYEINFCFRGSCYELINDEFYVLNAGDMLIMHPSVVHANVASINGWSINILIDESLINQFSAEFSKYRNDHFLSVVQNKSTFILFDTGSESHVCEIAREMFEKFNYGLFDGQSYDEMLIEIKLKELILAIILGELHGTVKRHSATGSREEKIAQILEYIRYNYSTITRESVSAKFGYSSRQLHRILVNATGTGFSSLVASHRLNAAMELLCYSKMPIGEIASTVGMEKSAFFRFMREKTGMSPLEYRKLKSV